MFRGILNSVPLTVLIVAMRLYALVEAGDPEAIDVYLCEEDAQRALDDSRASAIHSPCSRWGLDVWESLEETAGPSRMACSTRRPGPLLILTIPARRHRLRHLGKPTG